MIATLRSCMGPRPNQALQPTAAAISVSRDIKALGASPRLSLVVRRPDHRSWLLCRPSEYRLSAGRNNPRRYKLRLQEPK
jgi:hypothetical protein